MSLDVRLFQTVCRLSWLSQLGAALIGFPSALLYGWEEAVVFRHRKDQFNSSFFTLFALRAILSIASFLCQQFNRRLPALGLLMRVYESASNVLLGLLFFSIYYPFHAENLATLFLLLNRCCAVFRPFDYKAIWQRFTPAAVILTLALPLLVTVHIFQYSFYPDYLDSSNTSFIISYKWPPNYFFPIGIGYFSNNWIAAVSALSFMVLCTVLNLATLARYRLHGQANPHSIEALNQARVERSMTVYAVLSFFGHMLQAIYMLSHYVVSNMMAWPTDLERIVVNTAVIDQYCWVNDLATLAIPAWTILGTSSQMRELLSEQMPSCLRRSNNAHSVAVEPSTQNQLSG